MPKIRILQMAVFSITNKLKQKLGMLHSIRDQRTKEQGNKGTAKSCYTREVAYPCRYSSGHLIPNSVYT